METNRTTGSVFKNVLFFSLPYLLSYFLQTLYGMADLFIVGQYENVAATTAVSVGSQVMHMLTVMIVGLAMGSTVSIGQSVGRGDKARTSYAIGNTVTLFMALSLVLTGILLFSVRGIVSVMSTPEDAVSGTVSYLTVCFIGIPFITAYNIISSIYRGIGDSKSPLYFVAVACAANIALDFLFMGALRLGPVGAALGTTLSQALSVATALCAIVKTKSGITLKKEHLRPQKSVVGQLLRIGIPVALQDGLIQVGFIVITIIANRRGLADAAAVGIVEKIMSFLFLIPSSMLSAVSAIGAQNIGAGKPERAVGTLRCAAALACGCSFMIAVGVQFIAEPVIALFTDPTRADGAEVIRLGGQYLRGYVWDSFLAGIQFSFSGYFCAIGRSGFSFLHNALSIVCVRIPGAFLASKLFTDTLFPMGLASAAGSLFSDIVCVILFALLMHKAKHSRKEG